MRRLAVARPSMLGISLSRVSRAGRRLLLAVAATQLVACAGYVSYLAPPSSAKFDSAVDFAVAYTGGKEFMSSGVRMGGGQQCGLRRADGRNGFNAGAADICSRKGGGWSEPVCASGEDILFVAVVKNPPRRTCNQGLDDFVGFAAEPPAGMSRQAFTSAMEAEGHQAPARRRAMADARAKIDVEARQRQQAQAAEQERRREQEAEEERRRQEQAMAEQRARQAQADAREREEAARARERLLASAIVFRKSIKVGAVSNCGPVLEIRQKLAKVYFPVRDYGNEHWVDIDVLFPAGAGCRFENGHYVAPA